MKKIMDQSMHFAVAKMSQTKYIKGKVSKDDDEEVEADAGEDEDNPWEDEGNFTKERE
ncbi:hypothetical protein HK101_004770 [Irineochytrium annulatum]|nr:hypothetical protein HK101_004770 [Irineochytrium annulatum]